MILDGTYSPKAEKPPEAPSPLKPPEKKAPEKPPEPPPDNEARQGMLAFAREALGAATREQPQLNAFSRFGLNLYVAGACAAIGQAKRLAKAAMAHPRKLKNAATHEKRPLTGLNIS